MLFIVVLKCTRIHQIACNFQNFLGETPHTPPEGALPRRVASLHSVLRYAFFSGQSNFTSTCPVGPVGILHVC